MPEKLNVMKQMFIDSYVDAKRTAKQITMGQIDIAAGIDILHSLIKDLRMDIKTMDQDFYNQIEKIIDDLGRINHANKEKLLSKMQEPEDAIDERNQKRMILKEDLLKYKQILYSIQDIGYKKGWLEVIGS